MNVKTRKKRNKKGEGWMAEKDQTCDDSNELESNEMST